MTRKIHGDCVTTNTEEMSGVQDYQPDFTHCKGYPENTKSKKNWKKNSMASGRVKVKGMQLD